MLCHTGDPLMYILGILEEMLYIGVVNMSLDYKFMYLLLFFRLVRYGNPDEPIRLKYFKYTRDKVLLNLQ